MLARVLLVAAAGCTATTRLEVGVRKSGDLPPELRVGLSLGIGVGDVTRSSFESLTQSIGYRRLGADNGITTTTRYTHSLGPLHASGGLELSGDGVALLPTIQLPFVRRIHCTYARSCLEQDDSPVETAWFATTGLQLRLGRDDGNVVIGADVVLSLESFRSLARSPGSPL